MPSFNAFRRIERSVRLVSIIILAMALSLLEILSRQPWCISANDLLFASFCPRAAHFRSSPINGHRQTAPTGPVCATAQSRCASARCAGARAERPVVDRERTAIAWWQGQHDQQAYCWRATHDQEQQEDLRTITLIRRATTTVL